MAVLDKQTDFYNLVNSEKFGEFTQMLIKFTGLAMTLNSPEEICSNKFLGKRPNKICRMIRKTEQGQQKCQECDRRHYRMAANSRKSLIYSCHAGFWDIAVPVIVQGQHIATISSGQVLPAPVSEEGFQALQKRLAWFDISEKKMRKAYENAPYLPKKKLRYVIRLLELFATQLCESLRHIREMEEKLEKEEIRNAKVYIHEKYGNPLLSLSEVAEHVGFSKAYFSHIFKNVTGVSFTMFVQNCRIEEAKHLLAYTDQSITKICFHCGFNSLTHFNRIFRSFEGMSPRNYRQKD